MKKILIIGKRGFIGKNLNKFLKSEYNVKLISFKNALNFNQFTKYNFVINTSISKNYITKKYNKNFDNDTKIADRINNNKTVYVFLSSRKVYKAKPKIKYKKGTVINPPPIPNNPATKPTGIAVKAINKII